MSKTIYYYCNSEEVNMVGETIEVESEKIDTSTDPILENILQEEKECRGDLHATISYNKRGLVSKELKLLDNIFDNDFVCLKGFIAANKNMSDEQVAKDANDVWNLFGKYNLQLHSLSFERQFTLGNILFAKLEESEMKAKLDRLVGVSDCLTKAKTSLQNAEKCYQDLNAKEAQVKEMLSPSNQKNILRTIINEKLLPHLNNWNAVEPEKYGEFLDVINRRIEEVNSKARARKTRNANEEVEEDATQE